MFKRATGYAFTTGFVLIILYLAYLSISHPFMEIIGSSWGLFLFAVAVILLFLGFYRLISSFSRRTNIYIMIGLIGLIVFIQLFLASTMEMNAFADSLVVKGQANTMLQNGGQFQDYSYFQSYLNNVFVTIVRYELYHIGAFFGLFNQYLLDNFFIMFMMDITIFTLTYLVYKELGVKLTNIFLAFALTCVPLFAYVLYFYTDTIALPFVSLIILTYYFYLKKDKWWLLVILGILFAVGYQAKPNLIILFPALLIHLLFVKNFKRMLMSLLVVGVLFVGISQLAMPFYSLYGFQKSDAYEVPFTHYIMLGLKEPAGRFSQSEIEYTISFPTEEEKKQATEKVIKERLTTYTPEQFLTLYNNKLMNTWTDGTRAYSWYINSTNDFTKSYDYLFGDKQILVNTFAQIFHVMNLLLIALGAFRFFHKKEFNFAFFLNITLVGVIIFHLIWEANQRYILIFTPLMLLSALYGFKYLGELCFEGSSMKWRRFRQKIVLTLTTVIFLLAMTVLFSEYPEFAKDEREMHHYQVNQSYGYMEVPVSENSVVSQTFTAENAFDTIGFAILKSPDVSREYQLTLYDDVTNEVLYDQKIQGEELQGTNFELKLDKSIQSKDHTYKLMFTEHSKNAQGEGLSLGKYANKSFSLYPAGHFFINGKEIVDDDISFNISSTQNNSLLTPVQTSILFGGIFVLFGLSWYGLWRKDRFEKTI
ncbi:glycosyltransferase family 39 protein [Listeria ilorinensis]|uniref:glycosyltransferase family 39 protein n=1 Tax=Listeria ilorinensis TaxID=2867439 RepID=UPI001EF5637C|nr:glycosyltransferase family 39 protein [Listeria ilorinensis]